MTLLSLAHAKGSPPARLVGSLSWLQERHYPLAYLSGLASRSYPGPGRHSTGKAVN